jgi:hypothetical protein
MWRVVVLKGLSPNYCAAVLIASWKWPCGYITVKLYNCYIQQNVKRWFRFSNPGMPSALISLQGCSFANAFGFF